MLYTQIVSTYGVNRLLPWLKKIIDTRECGTLVGPPGSGKRRSLENTFNKLDTPFEKIDLLTTDTDIKTRLLNPNVNYFIVTHFDFANIDDLRQLSALHSAREQSQSQINFIYISSQDPLQYHQALDHYPFSKKIFANILYFPYSTPTEFPQLLSENQTRFTTKIPTKFHSQIYQLSGGCPYLIKNITKFYATHHRLPTLTDPDFMSLVHHLCVHLDPKFLDKDSPIPTNSTLIRDFLTSYNPNPNFIVNPIAKKILLNNLNITHKFLTKELEIIFELKTKNKLTREQIGQICFKNDDLFAYSDYSIDKLISRLRLKLRKIGANPDIIKTQKKYGYAFGG